VSATPTGSFVAIPIHLELFREILSRYPDDPRGLIEDVVGDFLERTSQEPYVSRAGLDGGVSWRPLFLPDKTRVRTKHLGEFKYAAVENGQLIFDGRKYSSMSKLANAMRGDTNNNAWLVLELRRPSDSRWIAADALRKGAPA